MNVQTEYEKIDMYECQYRPITNKPMRPIQWAQTNKAKLVCFSKYAHHMKSVIMFYMIQMWKLEHHHSKISVEFGLNNI